MKKDYFRKLIGGILLVSLLAIGFAKPVQQFFHIPKSITVFEGDRLSIPKGKAISALMQHDAKVTLQQDETSFSIQGNEIGKNEVLLELAGIPIKKVDVNILKDFKVVPGGQSIEVKLNTVGVLVVGHHQINGEEGKVSPGEVSGIKVGDMITEINGKRIKKMTEVAPFVQESGKSEHPLELLVTRDNETFKTKLTPVKDKQEHMFKLGLYIRDSAAGIGTMTFYHPKTKQYGALGHVISDMDTKKPIVVDKGEIVRSSVLSIEKGTTGDPGEKLARFSENREIIGNINKNSPFGIFGTLNQKLENGLKDKAIPVALSHQVEEGPAQILTVINDDEVRLFDIEVVSSVPQKFPATKGMVLKITDEALLGATGGIVQGMSGSPIIQKGKLIGAVTHVFVNDPTSGYGVHIEWMLNEAGINIYDNKLEKAS